MLKRINIVYFTSFTRLFSYVEVKLNLRWLELQDANSRYVADFCYTYLGASHSKSWKFLFTFQNKLTDFFKNFYLLLKITFCERLNFCPQQTVFISDYEKAVFVVVVLV